MKHLFFSTTKANHFDGSVTVEYNPDVVSMPTYFHNTYDAEDKVLFEIFSQCDVKSQYRDETMTDLHTYLHNLLCNHIPSRMFGNAFILMNPAQSDLIPMNHNKPETVRHWTNYQKASIICNKNLVIATSQMIAKDFIVIGNSQAVTFTDHNDFIGVVMLDKEKHGKSFTDLIKIVHLV